MYWADTVGATETSRCNFKALEHFSHENEALSDLASFMKGWIKISRWIDIIWELGKKNASWEFFETRTVVQGRPLDMYRVHPFQQ